MRIRSTTVLLLPAALLLAAPAALAQQPAAQPAVQQQRAGDQGGTPGTTNQDQRKTPPVTREEKRDVRKIGARKGTSGTSGQAQGQDQRKTPPITREGKRDVQKTGAQGTRPPAGDGAGIDRGQARALVEEVVHHRERLAKIDKLVAIFGEKKDDADAQAKIAKAEELRTKENERHDAAMQRFEATLGKANVERVLQRMKARAGERRQHAEGTGDAGRKDDRGTGAKGKEQKGTGAKGTDGKDRPAGRKP